MPDLPSPVPPVKSNPLNTSYNKTVYVSAFNALIVMIVTFGPRFGWQPSGEEVGAIHGVGSALITLFVPNKPPEN